MAAGIAGGGALWTAPETVPALVAATGLLLWWRWLQPDERPQPRLTSDILIGVSLSVMTILAVLVDPPFDGVWAPDTDRLSIVFVVFSLLLTLMLGMVTLPVVPFGSRLGKLGYLFCVGAMAGGAWLGLFPQALSGPIGQMSPDLQEKWLPLILEMRPIDTVMRAIYFLTPGLTGFVCAVLLVKQRLRQQRRPEAGLWFGVAGVILLALAGSAMAARFSYFSALSAIMPVMVVWRDCRWRSLAVRIYLLLLILCLPPLFGIVATKITRLVHVSLETEVSKRAYCGDITPVLPLLQQQSEPVIIMANENLGSQILWFTRHQVVAAPYHRNDQGILDEFSFFLTPDPEIVNRIAARRHLGLAVVCLEAPTVENASDDKVISRYRAIQEIAKGTLSVPEWEILAPGSADDMVVMRYHPAGDR